MSKLGIIIAKAKLVIIITPEVMRSRTKEEIWWLEEIVFTIPMEPLFDDFHAIHLLTSIFILLEQEEWIFSWKVDGRGIGTIISATEIYQRIFVVHTFWYLTMYLVRIQQFLIIPYYMTFFQTYQIKKRI